MCAPLLNVSDVIHINVPFLPILPEEVLLFLTTGLTGGHREYNGMRNYAVSRVPVYFVYKQGGCKKIKMV